MIYKIFLILDIILCYNNHCKAVDVRVVIIEAFLRDIVAGENNETLVMNSLTES